MAFFCVLFILYEAFIKRVYRVYDLKYLLYKHVLRRRRALKNFKKINVQSLEYGSYVYLDCFDVLE